LFILYLFVLFHTIFSSGSLLIVVVNSSRLNAITIISMGLQIRLNLTQLHHREVSGGAEGYSFKMHIYDLLNNFYGHQNEDQFENERREHTRILLHLVSSRIPPLHASLRVFTHRLAALFYAAAPHPPRHIHLIEFYLSTASCLFVFAVILSHSLHVTPLCPHDTSTLFSDFTHPNLIILTEVYILFT